MKKQMIPASLFTESLAISASLSRSIPASRLRLPYIINRMINQPQSPDQPKQEASHNVHRVHRPITSGYVREPMKPIMTTIKKRHHMSADGSMGRASYSTTSLGVTTIKETLGVVPESSSDSISGGWGIEWCQLIEIVACAYWEHGPNNSEKSYVDKTL